MRLPAVSTDESGPRAFAAPGTHDMVMTLVPPPPGSALDIGAGAGALSRRLLDQGYGVSACDAEPGLFEVTGVPCDRVDLSAGLPYNNNQFDCVLMVEVVEHLENPYLAVREAVRVAKPRGTIVITTPNTQSFLARCHFLLRGNFGRWFKDDDLRGTGSGADAGHIMPLHPLVISRMIERAGAKVAGIKTNELLSIRQINSGWSALGKIVEVFALPLMRPSDSILLRGDILGFKATKGPV